MEPKPSSEAQANLQRADGIAGGQSRATGKREHAVTGVDRLRFSPHFPDRRAVTTIGVAILDIVVDEGEVVHKLDRGGQRQNVCPFVCDCLGGQEARIGRKRFPPPGPGFRS